MIDFLVKTDDNFLIATSDSKGMPPLVPLRKIADLANTINYALESGDGSQVRVFKSLSDAEMKALSSYRDAYDALVDAVTVHHDTARSSGGALREAGWSVNEVSSLLGFTRNQMNTILAANSGAPHGSSAYALAPAPIGEGGSSILLARFERRGEELVLDTEVNGAPELRDAVRSLWSKAHAPVVETEDVAAESEVTEGAPDDGVETDADSVES